jgi:hypothetical protein
MIMKKTPVEWLVSELMEKGVINLDGWIWDDEVSIVEIVNQAKEMEETMVCDSWDDGYEKGLRTREEKITDPVFNAKHYYDTNYKKEEQ